MNRKTIEDRARQVASNTFSSGTMRTMLYEMICEAFGAPQVRAREATQPRGRPCDGTCNGTEFGDCSHDYG